MFTTRQSVRDQLPCRFAQVCAASLRFFLERLVEPLFEAEAQEFPLSAVLEAHLVAEVRVPHSEALLWVFCQ